MPHAFESRVAVVSHYYVGKADSSGRIKGANRGLENRDWCISTHERQR